MRILLVGNFEQKRGRVFYSFIRKIQNGLTRNGHQVIAFSDRSEARAATPFRLAGLGRGRTEKALVTLAGGIQPDAVLFLYADAVRPSVCTRLREALPALRLAYLNVDPLFIEENVQKIHRWAEAVDAVFVTTAGEPLKPFARPGCGVAFIPNPVDASIETLRCDARSGQPNDVFYAYGGGGTAGPERFETLNRLKALASEVRYDIRGEGEGPAVFGAAYFEAIASARMGLNLNRLTGWPLYSSDRFAQYAGNGLLTFVERQSGYEGIFTDEEFAFFETPEELADKLWFFCRNDAARQRVARAGRRRYLAVFNERLVARFIVEVLTEGAALGLYDWPTDVWRADA